MKFTLVAIVVILMILGIYTYNQGGEKGKRISTYSNSEKKEYLEKTEEVSVVVQEVKEKESYVKNIAVEPLKVISEEPYQQVEYEKELESIENADVSDEEKEGMRNDLIYYQLLHAEPSIQATEDEIIKMIEESSSDN